ncbi:MAG TPA: hypothetical protein VK923_13575, partial [Euzebyales bacterium]|nr:hypothetical protein [Euzebyales bacterium]
CHPFYAGFIAGVESVLARHDHSLVLRVVDEDVDGTHDAYQTLWAADLRNRSPYSSVIATPH